jgi:uncharacterized protein with PQ loop repeat
MLDDYQMETNGFVAVAPNVIAALLGGYYLYTFGQFSSQQRMLSHYMTVASLTTAAAAVAAFAPPELSSHIVGLMGCGIVMVMFGGPLMTLKTVIREKSTESMHFGFTVAGFFNCSLWALYGLLVVDNPYVYGPNIVAFVATLIQLLLFARYGIGKPKAK